MTEKYPNPPIVEAICEFKFKPDQSWDATLPGLVYASVREEYPHREQQNLPDITVSTIEGGIKQDVVAIQIMSFYNSDRTRFIRLGVDTVSIHCLHPYPTWSVFRPKIEDVYNKVRLITGPISLRRIGLRFVNRIIIPKQSFELSEYFNFRPNLGEGLGQKIIGFTMGCVLPFREDKDICKVKLSSSSADAPGSMAFILDLDYSLENADQLQPENTLSWIEEAHGSVERIFENSITDNLRSLFR
jgi:uncharacterized protein (TIGR04255 family)